MTATDELRRLLDERVVEWDYGIAGPTTTRFTVNGVDLTFTPMRDGLVCSTILTPEQAIATTLGSSNCTDDERTNGTCHDMYTDDDEWFACSECNTELCVHEPFVVIGSIRFCPNCGRKVVSE